MALRTFRSNPSLGGFGSESTAPRHLLLVGGNDKDANNDNDVDGAVADCDAFAQIVKELVDNAVDACGVPDASAAEEINSNKTKKKSKTKQKDATGPTMTTANKRVRVVIEKFSPPKTRETDNETDDETDNEQATVVDNTVSTAMPRELLRVTVSDNGCGMANIQDCVEAFKSSKTNNNNNGSASTTSPPNEQQQQAMTAGRYGIGLTLCLLHAQRLVPHSCASITSATASATHFTKASYVVDTEGDSVRCVELKKLAKTFREESGTSVSLLVPGGAAARWAWPRLAEYFARFRLSCGVPCSLHVMAATLAKAPLFVRPPLEERKRRQRQQHLRLLQEQQRQEQEEEEQQRLLELANQDDGTIDKGDEDDEEEWGDVFDDQDNPDYQQTIAEEEEMDSAPQLPVVTPATKRPNTAALQKAEQEEHRQEMHRAVELYLGHAVELANVAISHQPIRIGNGGATTPKKRQRGKKDKAGPSLEVTFVVCGVTEDEREEDEDLQEAPASSSSSNMATMMMVRMVNRIPLLDGAEASSCGLVQGLMQKKKVWNSFGLEVSSTGLLGLPLSRDSYMNDNASMALTKLPTFQVRDSDQVAPFLKSANHALFEDPFDKEDEEDGQDSDADLDDVEELATRRRGKRKRKKSRKWLLPAGIRLGKILVVVQIDAEPSSLPLPTLSKGRLPMDNLAIDKALEVALLECLRSLQMSNPDLLLTAQQLKRAERDARYVPAVAASIASIIAKSTDSSFQNSMTNLIRQWGIGGGPVEQVEEPEGDNDENEEAKEATAATVASQRTSTSCGNDATGALPPDADDREGEGDASVADGSNMVNQPSRRNGKEMQKLVRELGGNIETRLRQVLSSHEEESKKAKKKKPKRAKGDGVDDDAQTTKTDKGRDSDADDNNSHHSDSIRSYDFSASSKEPSEQGAPMKSQLDDDEEASLPQAQRSNVETKNVDTRDIFEDDDDWWPDN